MEVSCFPKNIFVDQYGLSQLQRDIMEEEVAPVDTDRRGRITRLGKYWMYRI